MNSTARDALRFAANHLIPTALLYAICAVGFAAAAGWLDGMSDTVTALGENLRLW